MREKNNNLVSKVEEALSKMFCDSTLSGKRILVALSGGADSVSLLLSLRELSEKYGYFLSACHINHMIRGDEADRDENFVKELCGKMSIPLYCKKFDIPALSKEQKTGLEETARNARYEYFESLVNDGYADYVATAHNACDNAESLLLNITRGCGVSGLCGIPMQREYIIRPLLHVERRQIEKYLSDKEQDFVTDSTNKLCDASRNIIRNKVIPILSEINPEFVKCADRLSEIATQENNFLEKTAQENYTDDIFKLASLDDVIAMRIISTIYRKECQYALEYVHRRLILSKIKEYAKSGSGEKKLLCLPDGFDAVFSNGRLIVRKHEKKMPPESYSMVANQGINVLCGGKIIAVMTKKMKAEQKLIFDNNKYNLFFEAPLCSALLSGKILLRSRLEGERIKISGHTRSVKKLYCEKKLTEDERIILPRICDSANGEILALAHVGICDRQKGANSSPDIQINLYIKE